MKHWRCEFTVHYQKRGSNPVTERIRIRMQSDLRTQTRRWVPLAVVIQRAPCFPPVNSHSWQTLCFLSNCDILNRDCGIVEVKSSFLSQATSKKEAVGIPREMPEGKTKSSYCQRVSQLILFVFTSNQPNQDLVRDLCCILIVVTCWGPC